jgi:hypothetical protein
MLYTTSLNWADRVAVRIYVTLGPHGHDCTLIGSFLTCIDCERSLLSAGLAFRACKRNGGTADNTSRNEIRVAHTTQNSHWSESIGGGGEEDLKCCCPENFFCRKSTALIYEWYIKSIGLVWTWHFFTTPFSRAKWIYTPPLILKPKLRPWSSPRKELYIFEAPGLHLWRFLKQILNWLYFTKIVIISQK